MEIWISIAFAAVIYFTLYLSLSGFGSRRDEIRNRVSAVSKMGKQEFILNEELNKPISERFLKPVLESIYSNIRKVVPENKKDDSGRKKTESGRLKNKLRQAGIRMSTAEYQAVRLIVIVGFAILFCIIAAAMSVKLHLIPLAALFGFYVGYVILRFNLAKRITKRHESMRRQLPEVLDMLSVSVEAGLGLEQAILHVIDHYAGPLIDELNITYKEMSMGRSRRDALLSLGNRCEVDEVNSFVRAVVQAGEMGISIKNVLRSQSAYIRQTRRNKVEEKAMQVSVKILLPMAFFIFPVIFIILMGPAVVSVYEQFIKM